MFKFPLKFFFIIDWAHAFKFKVIIFTIVLEAMGMSTEADLKSKEIPTLRQQNQIMSKQLADVIEQQQQQSNIFDMKFQKLLDVVDRWAAVTNDEGDGVISSIGEEIVKMMPIPATKEQRSQKIRDFQEERRRKADATAESS
jgi:Tfp pilus assembly protein PilN